ncbi:MAG: hypothetical protein ABH883_01330, partial [Candidatus Omnitrophota bacterium]
FQLPLYYYFEKKKFERDTVTAALYNLRNLQLKKYPDDRTDINTSMEICFKGLDFLLCEITDVNKPFLPDTGNEANCVNCPFKLMCR